MQIRRMTIRTNILSYFLVVVLGIACLLIGVQYYFSNRIAHDAIDRTFLQTAEKITLSLQKYDMQAKEILYKTVLSLFQSDSLIEIAPQHKIKIFTDILSQNKNTYSIYLASPDGDLFEIINMAESEHLYLHYKAPEKTRWTVISVKGVFPKRIREFVYLDADLKILSKRSDSSDYYANARPWFNDAMKTDDVVRSDPYFFANLEANGITFSKKINNDGYVLAIDLTMPALHNMLKRSKFSRSNQLFLFGRDGTIICSSDENQKADLLNLTEILQQGKTGEVVVRRADDNDYFAMVTLLSSELGQNTYLGISVAKAEMLQPYLDKIYYSLGLALLAVLLFIPLVLNVSWQIVKPINKLMIENTKISGRKFSEVEAIETNIVELISLSESQVLMSSSIQQYQENQKILMDSFIKLIANAIDTKSSYTGAHCKRVPIIATLLAHEAENSDIGTLKEFHLTSQEQWDEFERGAWLHDCGKITTPEYVVDKATKLETIYNRIHEIRTRFEVLWRDVDIEYFEKLAAGEDLSALDELRRQKHVALQEDFTFVAGCNLGDDFLTEEKKERLQEIAQQQWIRHFDDRLGLSEEELARHKVDDNTSLNAVENLLSDRPEHVVPRYNFDEKAYRAEGFKVDPPENEYNFGELYNLSIAKGTLTAEERFKINEHAIMTLRMLNQLPYPPEMEKVPEIAGNHHEKLNGDGYPRRLTREQLSISSRIISLADIFEALTATDRPYKKSKTLSETLKIMSFMVKDEHLDAELFKLFLHSGVYLEYAQSYLLPEQIDEVDVEALV